MTNKKIDTVEDDSTNEDQNNWDFSHGFKNSVN